MEFKDKMGNVDLERISEHLESSVYPSLDRVLGEAYGADAISFNNEFRKIFMNRLAEDLWYNNPLHPERKSSVCRPPFAAAAVGGVGLQRRQPFSWGMSRDQAATIVQVPVAKTADNNYDRNRAMEIAGVRLGGTAGGPNRLADPSTRPTENESKKYRRLKHLRDEIYLFFDAW